MSPEARKILRKRVSHALEANPFPPATLPVFEKAAVDRTIDRIDADDRLHVLFAGIEDDESLRRTFLSVYFQTLYLTP